MLMATNTMFGTPVRAVYDGSGNVVGLSAGGIALGVPIMMYQNSTDITSVANTAEQLLDQYLIPAGTLQLGDILRVKLRISKSSTVDSCTARLRLGLAGTVADTVVSTVAQPATTSRIFFNYREFIPVTSTSLRRIFPEQAIPFGTSAADVADVMISDILNPLYLSVTSQMTTGAETITLKYLSVELIRGA
jgi:hypothetical protein